MAQGSGAKMQKKAKSAAAAKKKVVRTKTVTKGWKEFKHKRIAEKAEEIATTKAINRKNEAGVAAKAVAVGTQFFLQDIASSGKTEMGKKLKERNKKQGKTTAGASERLKVQLRKLGRDV
jgi:hypothetical protein